MRKQALVGLILTALSYGDTAEAATSCVWTKQPDGTNWGTCVTDAGKNVCYLCPSAKKDTACPAVKCS